MEEQTPHFDTRLKEGVAYFEQMLKVMPEDRTTLEFLAVAYPQLAESEKAEWALSELARVVLAEGDLESAEALLPRLETCSSAQAKAMVLRIRASVVPRPDLVPETVDEGVRDGDFAQAVESEAQLADKLNESEASTHLRSLPDNGRVFLVSALATLEKDKSEVCEKALSQLADEYGEPPVPLDVFDPDRALVKKLDEALVRRRGVIPFAQLADVALVVSLSPHDSVLKQRVSEELGLKVRWFLAEPRLVEAALENLFPEDDGRR